jgi:hypothetical protein
MVRAIIDGRKTRTRRVMKKQPKWHPHGGRLAFDDRWNRGIVSPYGEEGDLLYVRETFCPGVVPKFRADYEDEDEVIIVGLNESLPVWGVAWSRSIHMPKAVARIWLRVTDLRVRRLQDITETDAIAEGIERVRDGAFGFRDYEWHEDPPRATHPVASFSTLWDSINFKRGHPWDANEWVWDISFEPYSHNQEEHR